MGRIGRYHPQRHRHHSVYSIRLETRKLETVYYDYAVS